MAKQILVPLDGTNNAELALSWLEEICDQEDEFILLRAERPVGPRRTGSSPGRGVMPDAIVGPMGGAMSVVSPDVPKFAETKDQSVQEQLDEAKDYLSPSGIHPHNDEKDSTDHKKGA